MLYICAMPNKGHPGRLRQLFSDDAGTITAFVTKHDRPGWAVYRCINPVRPDAQRRCLEELEALERHGLSAAR